MLSVLNERIVSASAAIVQDLIEEEFIGHETVAPQNRS
jgi:hypothetical protein